MIRNLRNINGFKKWFNYKFYKKAVARRPFCFRLKPERLRFVAPADLGKLGKVPGEDIAQTVPYPRPIGFPETFGGAVAPHVEEIVKVKQRLEEKQEKT